jgi:hypothetical protein
MDVPDTEEHECHGLRNAVIGAIVGAVLGWFGTYQVTRMQIQATREDAETARAEARAEEAKRREAERAQRAAERKVETYQRMRESAPTHYAKSLGLLIASATPEPGASVDDATVRAKAQAIVSNRFSYVKHLTSLTDLLDDEIVALRKELEASPPNMERIRALLRTLKEKWPDVIDQVGNEMEEILEEAGLQKVPD